MKHRQQTSHSGVRWEKVVGLIGLVVGLAGLIIAVLALQAAFENNQLASNSYSIAATQAAPQLDVQIIPPFNILSEVGSGTINCRRKLRLINKGASPALITEFNVFVHHNRFSVQMPSNRIWGDAAAIQENFGGMPIRRGRSYLLDGSLPAVSGVPDEELLKGVIQLPIRVEAANYVDVWTETRFDFEKKSEADRRFGMITTVDSEGYPFTLDKSDQVAPIEIYHVFYLSNGTEAMSDKLTCGYMPPYPYMSPTP